ncbi:hypothetical protein BIW11_09874 [Tropilaelaps mercedesae]|uniref:Uncharacterized protein n=1 Tax=Tropilaelaps mercedesae TaxID=418985 RepID=A0A1V9XIL4_9ACAR|nr:hypothetical protein BIW11_09874 [Tropilaelaps mercedesae]
MKDSRASGGVTQMGSTGFSDQSSLSSVEGTKVTQSIGLKENPFPGIDTLYEDLLPPSSAKKRPKLYCAMSADVSMRSG